MTTKLLSPLALRPLPERGLLRVAAAALSTGAYLLCLPWDLRNRAETPGALQETTPVEGAGLAGFVVVLLLLGGYFGARDRPAWAITLTAAPPVALLYASLSTHEAPDASPWPLAWAFFSLLIAAGVAGAAQAGRALGGRAGGGRTGGGRTDGGGRTGGGDAGRRPGRDTPGN